MSNGRQKKNASRRLHIRISTPSVTGKELPETKKIIEPTSETVKLGEIAKVTWK